jgi:hypothetical protein
MGLYSSWEVGKGEGAHSASIMYVVEAIQIISSDLIDLLLASLMTI